MEYADRLMNTFFYYVRRMGKSFLFFFSNLFVRRKYDVVFYYPAHFNRDAEHGNPFFQPFFETCRQHGLSYVVFEEPVLYERSNEGPGSTPFDMVFLVILILRKLIPLSRFSSFSERDHFIAHILKPLFFLRFSFNNYVVLSNSMLAFFRGLEKSANLYDYQHGIIHSIHPGYLQENGKTVPHIKENQANVMLYGQGFKNVLLEKNTDGYYNEHSHVIGFYDTSKEVSQPSTTRRFLLFSLQLINGKDPFDQKQYTFLLHFFESQKEIFLKNDLIVLLKNHPRYCGNIDMSKLEALPFIEFCDATIDECLNRSFLHMTLFSTCTFDAAQKSVPTLLMQNDFFPTEEVYGKDYDYPLGVLKESDIPNQLEKCLHDDSLFEDCSRRVFEWYKKFYANFDQRILANILNGGTH